MQPQVLSGARTILNFNGTQFAAGYVLNYNITQDVDDIEGLDNVFEEELAPRRIKVSMSIQVYRTPNNDPDQLNIAPAGGNQTQTSNSGGGSNSSTAVNFNPGVQYFTQSPYISIEIRDRVSGKTILFLPRARLVGRSGSGQAEDLISETWSIRGIGYTGPAGQINSVSGVLGGL